MTDTLATLGALTREYATPAGSNRLASLTSPARALAYDSTGDGAG